MLNEGKVKITKSELFIYIYISLLTIAKSIGLSSENKIYYLMFAFGLLLGVFKIINDRFKAREIILVLIGIIIGAAAFLVGHETTMLFSCLILICLKNIDIKKVLKIMFWLKLIIFILIIWLTITGIIDNNSVLVWRDGGYISRYAFVYGHPNSAQLNFAIIIFLWIYLYYDKINIFNITFLEIVNYAFYQLTLSRTGFIITAVFLIFAYIYKNFNAIKRISNKISKKYYIYMFLLTIVIGFAYGTNKFSVLNMIDGVMSGRLYYINYFLKNISIPLIGKGSYAPLMIDNGYISLLYNGGLLATVWFAYVSLKTSNYLFDKKMDREILITIILLTYSLAESFYMNTILNFSLFFFALYIYGSGKKQEEKK